MIWIIKLLCICLFFRPLPIKQKAPRFTARAFRLVWRGQDLEHVNSGKVYVVRRSSAAERPIGVETAKFSADRELRRKFIDRINCEGQVPATNIARNERDEVFIPRIVDAERAVERELVV